MEKVIAVHDAATNETYHVTLDDVSRCWRPQRDGDELVGTIHWGGGQAKNKDAPATPVETVPN